MAMFFTGCASPYDPDYPRSSREAAEERRLQKEIQANRDKDAGFWGTKIGKTFDWLGTFFYHAASNPLRDPR
jgi:hypothetical protein